MAVSSFPVYWWQMCDYEYDFMTKHYNNNYTNKIYIELILYIIVLITERHIVDDFRLKLENCHKCFISSHWDAPNVMREMSKELNSNPRICEIYQTQNKYKIF